MSKIQAVFFDLGDTLVKISSTIENEICKKIGEVRGTPLSVEEYTRASHEEWRRRSSSTATNAVKNIGFGAEEIERQYWMDYFKSLLPRLGLNSEHPILIKWLVHIYTDPNSFVCFDEVYSVLSELREKGYILGIISNAFPSAEKILDHLGLKQYFKYIFLSFELPYAKPESMIYRYAAQKTNILIENIVFVDDRLSFVQGAEKVNMKAWLIDRYVQDPSRSTTQPLVMNKIENLTELFRIVCVSNDKIESNDPRQSRSSAHRKDEFWDYCELPVDNSSRYFFEETGYAGRTTVPAYFSRVPR